MRKLDMTDVQELTEFRRPAPGPYICQITDVIDNPKEQYLEVEYDIADGEFKGYYTAARGRGLNWIGKYRKYYTDAAKRFFKTFCTAVSRSNGKFVFDAGDVNCDEKTLIGKKVGLNFQEVEYDANDGTVKTKLEVFREFDINKLSDQKIPEPKKKPAVVKRTSDEQLFVDIGEDEELPFA